MKNALVAGVVLLGAMALGGCGGSGSDSDSEAAAPSSDPASSQADIDRYASVVSRSYSDLQDQLDKLDDCDWAGPSGLDEPGSIVCSAGVLSVSLQSQTLTTALDSAKSDGDPPEEIDSLVSETVDSFNELAKTSQKLTDTSCESDGTPRCQRLQGQVFQDLAPAEDTLDAWGPYVS